MSPLNFTVLQPAAGMFYKIVSPDEVPGWLRDDAALHMETLAERLLIPEHTIEWFIPALTGEIPEPLWNEVQATLVETHYQVGYSIRSDLDCDPPVTDPVYFWSGGEVLGMAGKSVGEEPPVLRLRADLHRNGYDGLGFVLAHEMRHRFQAYWGPMMAGKKRPSKRDCERDAEHFAQDYIGWYVLSQDGVIDRITMHRVDEDRDRVPSLKGA